MQQPRVDTIIKSRSFADQTFDDMLEICNPALLKFGFAGFEYARVYDDGTALTLYSDPRIAKYIIGNQLHVTAHVPKDILSNEFWFVPDPRGHYSYIIREIKEISTTNSFANYIRRFEGYYEMFSFCDPAELSLSINKFVNKKEELEHFANHFVEQADGLISHVNKDRFKLTAAMMPNFQGIHSEEQVERINLQVYLAKVQRELMKLGASFSPKLSPQQLKCISLLLQGKTAPEMADQMQISYRTVELHLNLIREKLGCRKKSDIIDTIMSLHDQSTG